MSTSGWLNSQTAADVLGVKMNHLRVLAHRRKWRRMRRGREVFYLAQDVLEEKVRRDTAKMVARMRLCP